MFDDNPDVPHDTDEDASYVELRIEFEVQTDEEGTSGRVAAVNTHVHRVPDAAAVDAVLLAAKMLVMKEVAERMEIPEDMPEGLVSTMKEIIAMQYLKSRLDDDDFKGIDVEAVVVPNDASGLL